MKLCRIYFGLQLFLSAILVTINGCSYDKAELLNPNSQSCDTAMARYNTTVLPVLTTSCYNCHAGNFPSAGIKLDTYADVSMHARSGRLYGAISYSPGFVPMPLSATKLSDCKISSIKRWIDNGALND